MLSALIHKFKKYDFRRFSQFLKSEGEAALSLSFDSAQASHVAAVGANIYPQYPKTMKKTSFFALFLAARFCYVPCNNDYNHCDVTKLALLCIYSFLCPFGSTTVLGIGKEEIWLLSFVHPYSTPRFLFPRRCY